MTNETREWVYTGLVRLKGDKRGYGYWDVTKDRGFYFAKPMTASQIVGGVYSLIVEETEDGVKVVPKSGRFLRYFEDKERVNQWALEHLAEVTRQIQRSREVKAKKESFDLGTMTLQDLRVQMRKLPPEHARGLLATILYYLR